MDFKYKWWGKGDLDASFGLFFDGFSKIFTATGIMILVFGMPVALVLGKILPAIGLITFLGNLWYFHEARVLAYKEKRSNVTAQPFGIGGPVTLSWIFLIMGPVYWETGDAMLAFRVGLAAGFIGGLIEILGAFMGRWLLKVVPSSALLGNLASGAFVWLGLAGMFIVFDKPAIAVVPLFIILMDYITKSDRRLHKIPAGIVAIVVGTILGWATGYMNLETLTGAFGDIGLYTPSFFLVEVLEGLKDVGPYLPIIIPLQIANFLTTLQGVESAKQAGDCYPERQSMLMDGLFTVVGALLGNPFPTTVYYGHPSWKAIDARAGYSLLVGSVYLVVGMTGLTSVMMAIVPYEVVMVLLIFVGVSVTIDTLQRVEKRYYGVILLSMIPILAEYLKNMIESVLKAAGTTIAMIPRELFEEFSVPIGGIELLGNGAFLSSLLMAAWLACIVDKQYRKGAMFALVLALSACIGLIHNGQIELLPTRGVVVGAMYFIIALLTYQKGFLGVRTASCHEAAVVQNKL
ncbi:MAG: uracil permease [Cellulosilyticaceae bacterium]